MVCNVFLGDAALFNFGSNVNDKITKRRQKPGVSIMLQNYSRRNRRSSAGCENMESLQIRRVPFGSLTAGLQNRVLTVAGDEIEIDFAGTPPQLPRGG